MDGVDLDPDPILEKKSDPDPTQGFRSTASSAEELMVILVSGS